MNYLDNLFQSAVEIDDIEFLEPNIGSEETVNFSINYRTPVQLRYDDTKIAFAIDCLGKMVSLFIESHKKENNFFEPQLIYNYKTGSISALIKMRKKRKEDECQQKS